MNNQVNGIGQQAKSTHWRGSDLSSGGGGPAPDPLVAKITPGASLHFCDHPLLPRQFCLRSWTLFGEFLAASLIGRPTVHSHLTSYGVTCTTDCPNVGGKVRGLILIRVRLFYALIVNISTFLKKSTEKISGRLQWLSRSHSQ